MTISPSRKNLNAAANSRNPITTLTLLSQVPLLGSFLSRLGKSARKKKGEANVTANASAPKARSHHCSLAVTAAPPKPPKKGATQEKLRIVNVKAMNIVPQS